MGDTIAAVATPMARGAIGILRLSGPEAVRAASAVFRPASGRPLEAHEGRRLVYGTLYDREGNAIDQALATYTRGPGSYTGEDTAELQCHGSPAVLTLGLEALFAQGVRQAGPGEFTRRAFLNGRLDLTQAEAVADLIDAETASAVRQAAGQLSGAGRAAIAQGAVVSVMSQTVRGLQGSLSGLCADHDIDRTRLLTILRKLDFPRELFGRDLASYSDGQKKKVLLAVSLCCPAHLYIWDEPLNYIDLPSREQIEQMILQAQPTMLFVEHDAAFVRAVATARVRLYPAEP